MITLVRHALPACAWLLATAATAASPTSASLPPPKFAKPAGAAAPIPAPDMAAVLEAQAALGAKAVETLSPNAARVNPSPTDGVMAVMRKRSLSTAPDPAVTTRDAAYGRDLQQVARIYRPAAAGTKLPVVVYYHGGGWVIADLKTYDATPRLLAKELNAIVVSVEYRHAPEAKFPAQHDDADAAYAWVLGQVEGWGGDAAKIALAGESAGGNLAVATAIHARDTRLPMPRHILAVYPIANSSKTLPSRTDSGAAKPLNSAMLDWFGYYWSRSPADMQDPRINLVAANLRGLPPVTIVNAQIDPLRSDGETLRDALVTAGVEVDQRTFPGVTHEFFGMGKVVRGAREAETYAVTRLRGALN